MNYREIKTKTNASRNYVTPVSARQIGWLAFAEGLPIEEVLGDESMRRGWLQACRDCANAEAGTAYD